MVTQDGVIVSPRREGKKQFPKNSKSQDRGKGKGHIQYVNESQFKMKDMAVEPSSDKKNQRDQMHEKKSDHLYYREGAMNFITQQARENSSFHKMQQAL